MSDAESHEIILTIRREVEDAVDVILTAAEAALKELGAAREGGRLPRDVLEARLSEILEDTHFRGVQLPGYYRPAPVETGGDGDRGRQARNAERPAAQRAGPDRPGTGSNCRRRPDAKIRNLNDSPE